MPLPGRRGLVTWAGLLLCVLLGVFVGASLFTFHAGRGASYLSDDPKACVNCHIMREQYDGWQKASHHAFATCNDCHVPHHPINKWIVKAENGYWHSKGFTFQDFHEPIMLRPKSEQVLVNNCLHCHGQFVSQIAAHSNLHADASNCLRCHADVGHGAPQ